MHRGRDLHPLGRSIGVESFSCYENSFSFCRGVWDRYVANQGFCVRMYWFSDHVFHGSLFYDFPEVHYHYALPYVPSLSYVMSDIQVRQLVETLELCHKVDDLGANTGIQRTRSLRRNDRRRNGSCQTLCILDAFCYRQVFVKGHRSLNLHPLGGDIRSGRAPGINSGLVFSPMTLGNAPIGLAV